MQQRPSKPCSQHIEIELNSTSSSSSIISPTPNNLILQGYPVYSSLPLEPSENAQQISQAQKNAVTLKKIEDLDRQLKQKVFYIFKAWMYFTIAFYTYYVFRHLVSQNVGLINFINVFLGIYASIQVLISFHKKTSVMASRSLYAFLIQTLTKISIVINYNTIRISYLMEHTPLWLEEAVVKRGLLRFGGVLLFVLTLHLVADVYGTMKVRDILLKRETLKNNLNLENIENNQT